MLSSAARRSLQQLAATSAPARRFHQEVRKTDLICTQGFIGGRWVDAHAAQHYSVIGA